MNKTKIFSTFYSFILIVLVSANSTLYAQNAYAQNAYAQRTNVEQTNQALLESTSSINWVTKEFKSKISLDVDKAKIKMPSGKTTATNIITTRMADLIKDPLLTININSEKKLSDFVIEKNLSFHDLTYVIQNSTCTIGYFTQDTSTLTTNHTIALSKINPFFIKHTTPYRLRKPVEHVSSKPYTGIIIDARGKINVHGEFIKDEASPCFFPRIFSDDMELLYEKNMVEPEVCNLSGICHYDYSDDEKHYKDLVGPNALHIIAQESFGANRSDLIISKNDALKILSVPENIDLLKKGKIVILLNKDKLIYNVSVPLKDELYWTAFNSVKLYPTRELLGPDRIEDGPDGIKFLYNLKFVPNSPELLPEEKGRIAECAKLLKEAISKNEFTIFVGGHTADIGQPNNQLLLSIERTKTIINALVKEGIDEKIFSYRGYGATVPAVGGDNSTSEGRAVNRRVEITLRPKVTYIQRAN